MELKVRIKETNPHLIVIQEAKPKHEIVPEHYNIAGYEMEHKNIMEESCRGMLLYIDKKLSYTMINSDQLVKAEEAQICEIKLKLLIKGKDKLLLASIYRSPNSDVENNAKINELLKSVAEMGRSHVLIVGDFNYKDIDWSSYTNNSDCVDKEFNFIETIRDCYLYQHVTTPTRGRGSDKPSVLDLVFSNEEGIVDRVEILAPLGKSDHAVITTRINCRYDDSAYTKVRYHYDEVTIRR